ncbi:hypothetical protein PSH66_18195 [Pseudomonas sp. FP597]|uniref:hypothetical protein n=1 Tax=Pseudomonas sp. FP597 TaxID=2954096 RepID=UPI002734DEE9|nr:hypothetical protein [Pseudomonas sp. FP597]WLI04540.1 hypothetical protein PSH66_18195 [Pseudomonas sp. FP597]
MINKKKENLFITAKSGLVVNTADDIWTILPNNGKGRQLSVGWVHSSIMSEDEKCLVLDVFAFYVRTKAASTASGIVTNIKPFVFAGIPSLAKLKTIWSGLITNQKKGLNQFFGTLSKQGYEEYTECHKFTSSHLDKWHANPLDPSSGALNDSEFDSLARKINLSLQEFNWAGDRDLSFFKAQKLYGRLRNLVTNKLMLSIVRRPIQISLMKWSDLIPSGASFHDTGIRPSDEIGAVGGQTLQLRVYIAKSTGSIFPRERPERYPISISEDLSKTLIEYKLITLEGLAMLMQSSGIDISHSELLTLMTDMPMFPDLSLFESRFDSLNFFKKLFTPRSTAYHVSEAAVTHAMRNVKVTSDRVADCVPTSNRIRHTVLTRGAQDGLSAPQLAKITGVTVPAVRHYVDLNYESRLEIDSKYIGNDFLKRAFSSNLSVVFEGDEAIFDSNFNPVGAALDNHSCSTCSTILGRPLGCYGCPNFRPILEGDHRSVLAAAEDKLAVNRSSLINPLHARSIEKLERQIAWVKLTIDVCDENLSRLHAIEN